MLFVSVGPQPKDILQNLGFLQRCRGPFASTKHLVWVFFRWSNRMVPKSFSATWCVGARCTNCAFLSWTGMVGRWRSALLNDGSRFWSSRDHCRPRKRVGTQFKEITNANSIFPHTIDVRAPWRNGRSDTVTSTGFSSALVGCTPRAVLRFSTWLWNAMPRIDCPTVQAALFSSVCSGLDTVFPQT